MPKRTPAEEAAFKTARANLYRQPPVCAHCGSDGVRLNKAEKLLYCLDCQKETCVVCNNRGWVTPDVRADDARFGKAEYCPNGCEARRNQQYERQLRLYNAAELPGEYRKLTFASFDALFERRPELADGKWLAYHAALLFVTAANRNFTVDLADAARLARLKANHDERNSLLFYGVHGTGKTGLAAAIVNALVPLGVVMRYIRAQDFIEAVQRRYSEEARLKALDDGFVASGAAEVKDAVKDVPLLILDEFDLPGVDKSDDKQAIMELVINHRHNRHLPTIITTNLSSMAAMETRWGATTVSRVGQMCHWIEVGEPTLRPQPQFVGVR